MQFLINELDTTLTLNDTSALKDVSKTKILEVRHACPWASDKTGTTCMTRHSQPTVAVRAPAGMTAVCRLQAFHFLLWPHHLCLLWRNIQCDGKQKTQELIFDRRFFFSMKHAAQGRKGELSTSQPGRTGIIWQVEQQDPWGARSWLEGLHFQPETKSWEMWVQIPALVLGLTDLILKVSWASWSNNENLFYLCNSLQLWFLF